MGNCAGAFSFLPIEHDQYTDRKSKDAHYEVLGFYLDVGDGEDTPEYKPDGEGYNPEFASHEFAP